MIEHRPPLNGLLVRHSWQVALRQPKFRTNGYGLKNPRTADGSRHSRHLAIRFFLGFGPGLGGLSFRLANGSRFGDSPSTSTRSFTDTFSLRARVKSVLSVGFPVPRSSPDSRRNVSAAAARSCCVMPAAQRARRTLSPTRFVKRSKSTSGADRIAPLYYIPLKGCFLLRPMPSWSMFAPNGCPLPCAVTGERESAQCGR